MIVVGIWCIKKDEICIGESSKVTQHDPDFANADVDDDEEHLEAPHNPILDVNFVNKMLVFVIAKIYLKVIQGLGFALHLPHLTKTFQNNEEY